jgi:hypothetical protein
MAADDAAFAAVLRLLHAERRNQILAGHKGRVLRAMLTKKERGEILGKTDARCHVCGGIINGDDWQADHVLARRRWWQTFSRQLFSSSSICNNYRWHYGPEEFQWILKLGFENGKPIGREKACCIAAGRCRDIMPGRSYGAGGGGRGTFIVHTNGWRLPHGPSQ